MGEIIPYERRHLYNESFNDTEVKDKHIIYGKDLFGFEIKRNDKSIIESTYGIDLIAVHDPTIGIEVERGGAIHDYWTDERLSDRLEYGYPTLNKPDRKVNHWAEFYRRYDVDRKTFLDQIEIFNPGWNKNKFSRSNFFFNQFIIVEPEVILDILKTLEKRYKVGNNEYEEGWRSWIKPYTKTFNLINNIITLETDDPSTHLSPITIEERKRLENLKRKIKEDLKKQDIRAAYERAKRKI